MESFFAVDIIPLLFLFLCLYGARGRLVFSDDYLSKSTCKYYRGLFAFVVILHHLASSVDAGVLFSHFKYVGSYAVAFFFFLSGYGLQKSYIIKSEIYRKGFLLKRIPVVLIPYVFIIAMYWLMNLVLDRYYSIQDIFHSFIVGMPIAANSWFIVDILFFYVVFWFLMLVCKKNYFMMIVGGMIWYVLYVIFCIKMNFGHWWFLSSHLLVVGMLYSLYEEKIVNLFKKNKLVVIILLGCVFLFCQIIQQVGMLTGFSIWILRQPLCLLTNVIFVIIVLVFFIKFQIGNRALKFLGEISLELYISHGLVFMLFRNKYFYINNDLLWCICVLVGSVVLSYGLHLLFQSVLNIYMRTLSNVFSKTDTLSKM